MKVVILAAGYGSRLKAAVPKSLVRFSNGMCLLDYQLKALSQIVPMKDVMIVVGFKKELIMEAAPSCTFLYNHCFDRTNTAKSLLLALERLRDDVLWLNGDVFIQADAIGDIARQAGNSILVDRSSISDEEVCYTTDNQGRIARLAKGLGSLAEGEALGVNKISAKDIGTLVTALNEVSDTDYFERAIELGVEEGAFAFGPIFNKGRFVKEMDFQSDYDSIDQYIARSGRDE